MITRRQSIGLTLGALSAAALARAASPRVQQPLNELARAKGMRFGSAVSDNATGSFNDPSYAKLLETECGLLVAENELKWQSIRPSADEFDFDSFDHILAQAEARGLSMRGHNLLWPRPERMPAWLEGHDFGDRPASEAERLVTTHIKTVCARYLGRIQSYDVVNEAVLHEDGMLAQSALSRAMGGTLPLLDLAFHTAREAAPQAQLVYNDYMCWEGGHEKHREGVMKLLEGFRRRKVPVNALGIQSHLIYEDAPQEREWIQFIHDVSDMKYELLVTEFDVNDQNLPANPDKRDRAIADYAKDYLYIMFHYRNLKDFMVWGLSDGISWLQGFPPLRADGQPKRPCPYDVDLKPKPLHDVIAKAFISAHTR
jgi:endo-1,4-beta-xylanase